MPTETLTSRERVLRTLRREPVDRMPIDFGVHFSTGISVFAYQRLREHLGFDTSRITVVDMMQLLARVDEDVLERFHIDTMLLHAGWTDVAEWRPRDDYRFLMPRGAPLQREPDASFTMGSARLPAGGFFFDGDLPRVDDRTEAVWMGALAREARRIHEETPYATMMMGGYGGWLREDPGWLERCIEDPESVEAENERGVAGAIERTGRLIDALGDRVQLIELNGDMGTQRAPFISPKSFERLCAPYIRRYCEFVHAHSDWKVFHHTCGSIRPLLPIVIDCGIDVLNPVQVSAANMDPHELKAAFGDRVIFWGGGCDTQRVLGKAGPDAVRANVRELTSAFKPGGGFVFNQVHNVMGDVPPENVVAMFDEAYQRAWYDAPRCADPTHT
jgi:uroporphyrinogen decarboxylase